MKKLLSIVLVMAMLLSLAIAIPVSADTTTETVSKWDGTLPETASAFKVADSNATGGTETNPYLIESAADLANLAVYVNSGSGDDTKGQYFKLCCDIDIDNQQWIGIGSMSSVTDTTKSFQGIFDGDGHVIYNLNLKMNTLFVGFFACVTNGASISNLGIASGTINLSGSAQYCGTLVGYLNGASKIHNCFNAADINIKSTVRNLELGGLIGYVAGGTRSASAIDDNANQIKNSWNSGNITITSDSTAVNLRVGGIIGNTAASTYTAISNTVYTGNISCGKAASASSGFAAICGQLNSGGLFYSDVYAGGSVTANFVANATQKPIGEVFGYSAGVAKNISSVYHNVAITIDGVEQNYTDSTHVCGYMPSGRYINQNYKRVAETITVKNISAINNNFAQNGIDENAGNIRFVSELGFSAGAFSETGYVVEFATKSAEIGGKVVYTSLKAADAEAEGGYKTLTPTGKYYIAYGISGIPTTVSDTVTVTPYVVLLDGTTTVYGASAEYTITDGVLQQNS